MPLAYYQDDNDETNKEENSQSNGDSNSMDRAKAKFSSTGGPHDEEEEYLIFRGFSAIKKEIIKRHKKKVQEENLVKVLNYIAALCLIWILTFFAGVYFRGSNWFDISNPPLHVKLTALYLATWMLSFKWFIATRKKAEEKYDDLKKRLQAVADKKMCQHELSCGCKERFFKELEEAGINIYY